MTAYSARNVTQPHRVPHQIKPYSGSFGPFHVLFKDVIGIILIKLHPGNQSSGILRILLSFCADQALWDTIAIWKVFEKEAPQVTSNVVSAYLDMGHEWTVTR